MQVRFESLQALRGVACLVVVLYHIAGAENGYGLGFAPFRPVMWFGFAGVDLFFVLSGFIIATTCRAELGKPGRLPGYLFRRAWRVFPVYWVAFLMAGLWFLATAPPTLQRPGAGEMVDMILLLPARAIQPILPVAWSLTYELMFYAAFAALFVLPRRLAPFALTAWAVAVVGCAAAGYRPANRFAALALHPFVLEFLAGCLVAWLPIRLNWRQAKWVLGAAAAWCGAGLWMAYNPDATRLAISAGPRILVFGVPAALVVLAFTALERGGVRFRRGRLSKVGDASYSIYLIHAPLLGLTTYLSILANMGHSRAPHCAWLVMMLAAGVVPGLLLYRYVETPLMRLGKRKRPAPPTPEAIPPRLAA